jgi:hypothetical protein
LNIVSMVTQGVQFTSVGVNLCHVDVEEANWIHLEGLLARFVAVNLRQSADAAALQAEIQRRSGQAQETAPGANRGSRRAARGCAGGQATMIASTSVVSTVEHGVFASPSPRRARRYAYAASRPYWGSVHAVRHDL